MNQNDACGNNKNEEIDNEEPIGMADALMKRGELLRKLRQMELADQAEREAERNDSIKQQQEELQDIIDVLENGERVLRYDSYLAHQRYYDDLKHVDYHYIDYGSIGGENDCNHGRLVIEQDKSLGKGGLCWDAAFILGEHLIVHSNEWNSKSPSIDKPTLLVELGSGTGLAGLMIAKAVPCHVRITDLPELLPLMTRNTIRNFDTNYIMKIESDSSSTKGEMNQTKQRANEKDDEGMQQLFYSTRDEECETDKATTQTNAKHSLGSVSANVLRWGVTDDYKQQYDVVLGADVVASLYDPIALAETMHALCHSKSVVFVSYKGRLTGPHEKFEKRLTSLFGTVERLRPTSRNRNPEVWILKATQKKID